MAPGTVLVTDAVRDTVDSFTFRWFGECDLKGFDEPAALYEVLRP